jgi:ankyrin repeat protein
MGIPDDPKISPFTRYRIDFKLDNLKSARERLQYLCMEDFATGCIYDADIYFERRKQHPFLSYASEHWDIHASYDIWDTGLLELMCSLFKPEKSLQFLSWIQEKILLAMCQLDFEFDDETGTVAEYLNDIAEQLSDVSKIHVAASIPLPGVVSWLVEQGSDVNMQSNTIGTPLISATACLGSLRTLLGEEFSRIIGVSKEVWRLEHRLDTIEVPVRAGADPNIQGPDGITALQQMLILEPDFIESKQTFCETSLKIIQGLCKAGAICTKEVLEDYFHRALLQKFPSNSFSISELLPDDKLHIQKGISPLVDRMMREIDGFGQTEGYKSRPQLSDEAYGRMMRDAAGLGEVEALQKYFEKSRSIDLKDDRMRTALHIAAFRGRLDAAKFLIQHQADPKACDIDGNTPLHLACIGNREETIHHLWGYSEMKNSKGESPLMLAAAHCSPSTLLSLMERASQEAICERATNGYSMLHFAAAAWKALNVAHLIDKGLDVSAVSNDMWTPIMAAMKGNGNSNASDLDSSLELILKTLIDRGANSTLDLQDKEGQTCLHILCQYADGDEGEQAAKILLEHGASCELKNTEQNTALEEALQARYENTGIVDLLIGKHPDLNQQDEQGQTILHRIFGVRRPSSFDRIARSAIERKGDLSVKNREGMTVLISAFYCHQRTNILKILLSSVPDDDLSKHSFKGSGLLNLSMRYSLQTEAVSIILDRTKDVNSRENHSWGWNALHTACAFIPSPKIMRRILSLSDNLSIEDHFGRSLLFLAAQNGNAWMVSELIAKKVNLDNRGWLRPHGRCNTTTKDLTPLLATACRKDKRIHRECAELLIEAGADLEARDSDGWGLIAYCSRVGDEEALRYLSTTKIDLASVFPVVLSDNKIDHTALHLVAEKGYLECVRVLLKTEAFPSVDVAPQHGVTPLLIAVMFDRLDICKVLCSSGAEVNVIDTTNGNSPLHEAAVIGSKPITLLLLQQGADVILQNNAAFTAEYEALARCHYEIAEILNTKASDIKGASDRM